MHTDAERIAELEAEVVRLTKQAADSLQWVVDADLRQQGIERQRDAARQLVQVLKVRVEVAESMLAAATERLTAVLNALPEAIEAARDAGYTSDDDKAGEAMGRCWALINAAIATGTAARQEGT